MCAIAGLVDFGHRPVGEMTAALEQMRQALVHRGPDDWGRTILHGESISDVSASGERSAPRQAPSGAASVYLAHQRLAIIDLTPGGHQPMAGAAQSSWIVYNGELYNYRELRQRLTAEGRTCRGSSDTEVLLGLVDQRGADALAWLRGMFAFAHWDERRQRLMLARDRFGIKPLLFARPHPDLFAFASEPRALIVAGLASAEVATGRRSEFLQRGAIGAASTYWRDLDAIAPGEWLTFDGREVTRRPYWSAADVLLRPRDERPAVDVAKVVRAALTESVAAHLVSDVPVGVFLSGGLDSAAILAAATRATSAPVQTFTVTMGRDAGDEAAGARETARYFQSDHLELAAGDLDVDAAIDEFFAAMQEPTIDGFNSFIVARAARRAGLRVVLSGVGGDEMLGGYPSFTEVPSLARLLRWTRPALRASAPLLRLWRSTRGVKLADISRTKGGSVADAWWAYRGVFSEPDANRLSDDAWSRPIVASGHYAAPFDVVRACEIEEFLERQLLRDADAFTMCRALELRTPFVDHVFLEQIAAAGLWRRDRGSFKQALFAAWPELARPGLASAPKRGFVLPFAHWMRVALESPQPRRLADFKQRLAEPRYRPWVDQFLTGRLHWSRLWAIYVADRFTKSETGRLSPSTTAWNFLSSSSPTTRAVTSARA